MNVLLKAKEENIAVGAVNIFNYLTAEAAVKAAEEIGVNLIIQTSAGTVEHFGAQKLYDIVDAARKGAKIEVALHLDHCRNKELGKLCADTGWDSIMMDFSHLPFEENIANTREMAEYAHSRNVAIEGEIGVISGVEEDIVSDEAVGADFEETMEFVERSQIDAVAPAIGTAHGIYHGVPKINFELVEKLGKERLSKIYDLADVYHCDNIDKVSDDFIQDAEIKTGNFDNVAACRYAIPTHWDIGKVYKRLIKQVSENERIEVIDALIKVYRSFISTKIDDYNSSVYYENPSYIYESYRENKML